MKLVTKAEAAHSNFLTTEEGIGSTEVHGGEFSVDLRATYSFLRG